MTRPDRRAGMLTHSVLSLLWQDSPDAAPDDEEDNAWGCCPSCCAPCAALADLVKTGELDAWVLAWPDTLPGTSWWTDANRVDRAWLLRSWSRTDRLACHEDMPDVEREVTALLDLLRKEIP